jgi:Flp pilus assembly protein TadB
MEFFETFGKAFVFKKIRPILHDYLMKAGYDDVPYSLFGVMFFIFIAITLVTYVGFIYLRIAQLNSLIFTSLTFMYWVFLPLCLASFFVVAFYVVTDLRIYNRTKEMEKMLPDYLQLVSTNLKGGMSFEKSLWAAVRPEFKVLAKEITIVSKKVLTGNDLSEALAEFMRKYDSPLLKRSVELIIGEVSSGGKISAVIDEVIETLRKTRSLREEMAASTLTYIIFVGAIVMVVAPGLFALAYQLLILVVGFTGQFAGTELTSSSLPLQLSKVSVSPVAFRTFSMFSLSVIAISASSIVSIIQKGDVKGGLKYIPLFFIVSMVFYFVFIALLGALFGGIKI